MIKKLFSGIFLGAIIGAITFSPLIALSHGPRLPIHWAGVQAVLLSSGGLVGGQGSGGDLTLESTTNAVKGSIKFTDLSTNGPIFTSAGDGTLNSETTLAIVRGGTNGATALAGFNNLSPLITRGDILIRDATNNIRLAIGAANRVLLSDGTDPAWQPQSAIDHGSLGGLSDDDHAQYALLAGRAGGQTQVGGTAAGEDLTLSSTSDGSKGSVIIQDTVELSALTTNGPTFTSGGDGTMNSEALLALIRGGTNKSLTAVNGGVCYMDADSIEVSAAGTLGQILHSAGAGTPTWAELDLASEVGATILPIANGGTNGATAQAGFDNLSPVTTRGDLIVRGATNNDRLAVGTSAQVLTSDGTDPVWAQVNLAAQVTGLLPLANGGGNKNLTAVNGGVLYTDADSHEVTAAGTSGQILTSSGAGAPTWENDSALVDIAFPQGFSGTPIVKSVDPSTSYTVTAGKTLYIMSMYNTDAAGNPQIMQFDDVDVYKITQHIANDGTEFLGGPIIVAAGTKIDATDTDDLVFTGFEVTNIASVNPVNECFDDTSSYTVTTGKTLYITSLSNQGTSGNANKLAFDTVSVLGLGGVSTVGGSKTFPIPIVVAADVVLDANVTTASDDICITGYEN